MDSPATVRFPLGRQSSYAALDKLDNNNNYSDDDNDIIHHQNNRRLPLIALTDGSSDGTVEEPEGEDYVGDEIDIPASVKLMFAAHEGDVDGIKELVQQSGAEVNYRDIDNRTPLHVAACQGYVEVVDVLIQMDAEVDPKDRWGSTVIITLTFPSSSYYVVNMENY